MPNRETNNMGWEIINKNKGYIFRIKNVEIDIYYITCYIKC